MLSPERSAATYTMSPLTYRPQIRSRNVCAPRRAGDGGIAEVNERERLAGRHVRACALDSDQVRGTGNRSY
jgi:hypothetical protein